MKLYYTSFLEGEIQTDPGLSLGGYQSESQVPNNRFSTLFSQITPLTLSQEIVEDQYIGLILENDSNEVISPRFYFTYNEDTFSEYSIAVVELNQNEMMERVASKESMPLYAEFNKAEEQDPLSLGEIQPGQKIGIWVCRHIKDDVLETIKGDIYYYTSGAEQCDLVTATELSKYDTLQLNFMYNK